MPYTVLKEDTPVDVKAIDLLKAYGEGKLPREGGYIVTSFFQTNSAYAKYEIVAFSSLKGLYLSEAGLTFQTDGNKLFVLAEPATYERKHLEPYARDGQQQIPHHFSEVEQITANNMTRIMLSKQPVITYYAFTICKPTTLNFSILFYNLPDVFDSIAAYFEKTLTADANVPAGDAAAAARRIVAGLKRFTIWQELVAKAAPPRLKKAAPRKVIARKPAAKKATPKKAAAKKVAKEKAPARKPAVKKPTRKKPAAKKTAAKKPSSKKPARRR
jgi:hypothetical protein